MKIKESSKDISFYSSVLDSKRLTFKDVRIQKKKYIQQNNNTDKNRKKIINEDIPMKI